MSTRPLTAAAALALALTGCIRDPDPFTVDADDVAVHLLLVAGADSVQAIVERPGNPAEDAAVLLIAGADTTPLVFSGPACAAFFGPTPPTGCHRARLEAPIQAGVTYELRVVLEDGTRITGSTRVPERVTITAPAPDARLTLRCGAADTCYAAPLDEPPYFVPVLDVTVRWQQPLVPERLFGHVRPVRTFLDGAAYAAPDGCDLGYHYTGGFAYYPSGRSDAATDSMRLTIPNIFCVEPLTPAVFDSIHAEVVVQEISPTYAAYLEAVGSGRSTREAFISEGLEGAWGVFGAMTPTAVPVTLVRQPPPS